MNDEVTVTVEVDDTKYRATVNADNEVEIDIDGAWAGEGRWENGQIVDCAANIREVVYDLLDAAIGDAFAAREV